MTDYRKSHMRFRLVPKLLTLDDLELLYISSNFLRVLRYFAFLGGNNSIVSDGIVSNFYQIYVDIAGLGELCTKAIARLPLS